MRQNQNTLQYKLNKSFTAFRDNIAVECGDKVVTYDVLQRKAVYIARWLVRKGVKKETVVGILANDRLQLIVAVIGILRAGCVFVPLDSAYPQNRLKRMMDTTNVRLILTDNDYFNRFSAASDAEVKENRREFVRIDDIFLNEESLGIGNGIDIDYSPEDKIYIYFTSGTTSTPRAFLGKNKSLLHFINWEVAAFGVDETFRFSQFTSPGFDAFLRDVFVPLCSGGRICIPKDPETLLNPEQLLLWAEQSGICLIHCVPSLFRLLNADGLTGNRLKDLKFILLSGERIHPQHLVSWYDTFDGQIQLVNLWGTSETTLAKTVYFIGKADVHRERIPVGKPIAGAQVIVMDKGMNICKENIVGQLYIRTPYRTFGYLNEPELNEQRFIPNPLNNNPDDSWHKTGDVGRLLSDGNIELLGRDDRQVKIRGIRIELEEIESLLVKSTVVHEAVVMKRLTPTNEEFLCAYITLTKRKPNKEEISSLEEDLKNYLSDELPGDMVPTIILNVEKIPRTPNGKIDYDQLQLHDPLENREENLIPPRNSIEEKLLEQWREVLRVEKIGVTSHFFKLGGNSLSIMSLISKIHKVFDVRIPLGKIFNNPTIEKQAQIIMESGEDKDKYASIQAIEKREYYEISYAQRRVWVLSQLKDASLAFNMPDAYGLTGELHREAFEKAFFNLVERHESLRTVFLPLSGDTYQKILSPVEMNFKLNYIDLRDFEEEVKEQKARNLSITESNTPFDLSKGPLLRATLVQMEEKSYIFLFTLHHIVSDLLSLRLLASEVFALYNAFEKGKANPMGRLRIHCKDYCVWQNNRLKGDYLKKHQDYWLSRFREENSPLQLPLDKQRPEFQTYKGEMKGFQMGETLTRQWRSLSEQYDVTLFMTLFASVIVLLYHYSGQTDIVIGIPIAGRQHAELEDQIGFYLNTLALRTCFEEDHRFCELLLNVKEVALGAFEHQAYPFDKLVEELGGKRDMSRHPLFDVVIDMQNYTQPKDVNPGFQADVKIYPYFTGLKSCKFDLAFYVSEGPKTINVNFEYNTDIFAEETILRMIERFRRLLNSIVEDPEAVISEFQLDEEVEIPRFYPMQRKVIAE